MSWNFTEIVSTQDSPNDPSHNVMEVRFDYTTDQSSTKIVNFTFPKDFTQEQIQAAIGTFLATELNLFIKINKDDILVGYKAISDMINGIASISSSLQRRREKLQSLMTEVDEQDALLQTQRDTLDRIVEYLQSRAV